MKSIVRIPLIVLVAHAGCSGGDDVEPGARDVARDVLTIEHSIGAVDRERPEYEFGAIGGLALLHDGRVAMVDRMNSEIRVFEADGSHVLSFGRNGAGPGEFSGPCCISIDDRQRLWVRDGGNARYSIFAIGDDSAAYLGQVRMAHGDVNRWAPLTFDPDGNVIDIGNRTDRASGVTQTFRLHVDSAGRVVSEEAVHKVPDDSTAVKEVQRTMAGGTATLYAYQPFGPGELVGYSPTGEFAHALSSRYAIDWRAPDGSLVRTLSRDVPQGPALSDGERAAGEEQMEDQAEWTGVSRARLGFDVPSHKPVLRVLFFDRHGRLWVELMVPDGSDRRADVYSLDGILERTVSWPAHVTLSDGAIRGDDIWGIGRDSLDVPTLVRLTGLGTRS